MQNVQNHSTTNQDNHSVVNNNTAIYLNANPKELERLGFGAAVLQGGAILRASVLPDKPLSDSDAKSATDQEPDLETMAPWQRTIVCIATILPGLNWQEFDEIIQILLVRYPAPKLVVPEATTDEKPKLVEQKPSPLETWQEDPYICLRNCGLLSGRHGITFSNDIWRDTALKFFTDKAWLLSQGELSRLVDSKIFLEGTPNQRAALSKQLIANLQSDLAQFGREVLATLSARFEEIRFKLLTEPASPRDSIQISNAAEFFARLDAEPTLRSWLHEHLAILKATRSGQDDQPNATVALVHTIYRMPTSPPEQRLQWLLGLLENNDDDRTLMSMVEIATWSWLDSTEAFSAVWSELARQTQVPRPNAAIERAIVRVVRRQFFASISTWSDDENAAIMAAFLDPQRRGGKERQRVLQTLADMATNASGFADEILATIENPPKRLAQPRLVSRDWMARRAQTFAGCLLITAPRPLLEPPPRGYRPFLLRLPSETPDANWAVPVLAWLLTSQGAVSTAALETIVFDLSLFVQAAGPADRQAKADECGKAFNALLLAIGSTDARRTAADYLVAMGVAVREMETAMHRLLRPRQVGTDAIATTLRSVTFILQATLQRFLPALQTSRR